MRQASMGVLRDRCGQKPSCHMKFVLYKGELRAFFTGVAPAASA